MKRTNIFNQTMNLALASTLVACAAADTRATAAGENAMRETAATLQPQLHIYESDASGFNTKTVFYDNGSEVVAFDSQFTSNLARKSIEFLRTKTQNPIRFLVITHPNPDKFNGISEFRKEGAKVVASNATVDGMPATHAYKKYFFVNLAKMFTEENYPELELNKIDKNVDETFDKTYKLDLSGGDSIQLQELSSPGVSTNQTVALIPSARALVVGDLVHHRAHAWLEGGITKDGAARPTIAGWIKDLKELQAKYGQQDGLQVVGGRGEAAPLNAAVIEQIAYLKKADAIVSDYVQKLGTRKADLTGANAGTHHEAIMKRFEKEFPGYSLSYMIQYGVYGLANSKM